MPPLLSHEHGSEYHRRFGLPSRCSPGASRIVRLCWSSAGLILWPSAGKSSTLKARNRAGGSALPSLSFAVKHDGGACSAAAAAPHPWVSGDPPAAAPHPPPDLLLSNTSVCPTCLYKTCQKLYSLFWPFGWDFDFWKPDRLCGASCFALVWPVLDLYRVWQRVSSFQEAVLASIAMVFASICTLLAAPFYVP